MSSDSSPGAAIAVEGLGKTFRLPHEQVHTIKERVLHPFRRRTVDAFVALHDVSFEVGSGESFGIVGRNGSGKSTLLKCLAGIYRPDAGEIWLRGRMAPFIELGVGFNPDLTARDNVLINAIMLGLSPREARRRYDTVIEFAELEEFVDLKLKNYSSGMQVRLAFSVMIQVDADLLLIDEVLAVGDAAFQQKCQEVLDGMRAEGRTVVLVTHDMAAVERFCDRAMLIERGGIVSMGAPRNVTPLYREINFADRESVASGVGDGAAEIVDAWFEGADGRRATRLEQGQRCSFHVRVRTHRAIEHPSVSFALTDNQRRRVFAASSRAPWPDTGTYAAGDELHAVIRFDNHFVPGRYFASPEVAHHGAGTRLIDHRPDLVSLLVTGPHTSGALVDLPYTVEVTRTTGDVVAASGV